MGGELRKEREMGHYGADILKKEKTKTKAEKNGCNRSCIWNHVKSIWAGRPKQASVVSSLIFCNLSRNIMMLKFFLFVSSFLLFQNYISSSGEKSTSFCSTTFLNECFLLAAAEEYWGMGRNERFVFRVCSRSSPFLKLDSSWKLS